MAFTKRECIDGQTVISAELMNDIQDEILKSFRSENGEPLSLEQGGTGANTPDGVLLKLHPTEGVVKYLCSFDDGWGNGGYCTPRMLRAAMGMGDTLMALGVECGGTGATDAATARENLGAAPAGFGLGTNGQMATDWNAAVKSGLFYGNKNSPDGGWWNGVVSAESAGYCTQLLFKSVSNNICIRHMNNGVWGPFEWFNPPMALGAEYRTTERWNGKAVWTVLVDCGTAVAGENTISTNFACSRVFGSRGYMGGGAIPQTYDSARNDRYFKACNASNVSGKIAIVLELGSAQSSSAPCHVQVWYTKD